ncbi:Sorting nexin MVP1 [Leucoagaricus sp. SymC.cos]|nr:Sorting nexin MVP1 [Leucoagaricus sp. SymC.cos]
MFNAPRPGQRYIATSTNGFGGSFVDENPLANSVYDDGLDPWSSAPSPVPTPIPNNPSSVTFSSVIADATVPTIYHRAFNAVDNSGMGETSVNSLSRVLATSGLSASTIDRIVNLVSSRPRVSKLEFFVALALVALAQTGKDTSIEQVAALASQNALPEPTLGLDRLQTSTSTFHVPPPSRQTSINPWSTIPQFNIPPSSTIPSVSAGGSMTGGIINGVQSALSGTGLPPEWWKRQESVRVTILGQQGFILNRYTVYEITTESGVTVTRRYSEFVYLWEVLTRRYPFRLFPALPPKRIGPDEHFLEQRRRGLQRALNFVLNHPVLKEDGVLGVFLTVPSFETWRKQTSVSLDEESLSKKVDRVEEMSIPSDLEEKIAVVKARLGPLIEQWQRICILAERIMKRHEAAAVRSPPAFRRAYLPTHFALPNFSPISSTASLPGSSSSNLSASLNQSILGLRLPAVEEQGDLSRFTNTLRAVIEVNEHCWRGDECDLSNGVRLGLEQLATHTQRHSDLSEARTRALMDTTLESLKAQRDLYMATRDLLIRHVRLSVDQVDRLRKRVDATSVKLDGVRAAAKDGWQEEVDKLAAVIEKDQGTIAAQLSRRVFIRVCLWNELRIILHNRENTLITQTVKIFAREEQEYAENVLRNWVSLGESVENMPYE